MLSAPNPVKPSLTEEERAHLRALYRALEPFWDLEHSVMPASYIRAALLVAMNEGLSVSEYAEQAGTGATVMTRNLLDIGERNRQREKGLELITQVRDAFDLRKHRAMLTPKGRKLMQDVITALRAVPKSVARE
ncbi:hypothetical protein [Bradyrhizobium centrosematis]|uniref:hypothetical protein n=1 Tax=Bradyrhizobium centrosematis TaxID=1300039 RepID=UPI00388F21E4